MKIEHNLQCLIKVEISLIKIIDIKNDILNVTILL